MRFSLRDLFWLTAVVALSIGWALDHNWESGRKIKVSAAVIAVTMNGELAEIAAGTDDGLRTGQELNLYRGQQNVGRIVILRTSYDRAVAQFTGGLNRARFRQGDQVKGQVALRLQDH